MMRAIVAVVAVGLCVSALAFVWAVVWLLLNL